MKSHLTKEIIQDKLRMVQDPRFNQDIHSLGFVREIGLETGNVFIHLGIPAESSEFRDRIKEEVERRVKELRDVKRLTVQVSHSVMEGPNTFAKVPLQGIQNVMAIASGKGGVGKSTVAVNLAVAFSKMGHRVGLMDGDIYGPNIPLMLGVPGDIRPRINSEKKIVPLDAYGIRVISMGFFIPPDQPLIWRGPTLHNAVNQFLQKVEWGELDYLFVDLPPGTGDVQLSLVQSTSLTGAIMVTMPQEVSLLDVRKGLMMFRRTNVPILGIVENMSGEIFGRDGGRKAAREFDVPFLGTIPLDVEVRRAGDGGCPIVSKSAECEAAKSFFQISERLMEILSKIPATI
ncbi:MAG: Mrp/NBP35 family ATP-binding protein [Candidatus Omnitrophica bacterium]|nr:Mrp/NBP35 family ATP-binding protein [Candidatus Omnitrophota bacterium]